MNSVESYLQRLKQEVENDKCPIAPIHVDEAHPAWFMSVEALGRRAGGYWRMFKDSQRQRAYANFLAENAEGKVVCDLGCGPGALLYLAEYFGAKKCIGIEQQFHPVVYLRGRFKHWNIIQGDFTEVDWPEADIYIHEMIANNVYEEGLISLCDAAKERGVYDKLYPNTVRLYDITMKEDKDFLTTDGGPIETYTEAFLDRMTPILEGKRQVRQRFFDYKDCLEDISQIYSGDFYGGLQYEFHGDHSEDSYCGWEVGFNHKHLFSNFREPTHWALTKYWDFHNKWEDSPNPFAMSEENYG